MNSQSSDLVYLDPSDEAEAERLDRLHGISDEDDLNANDRAALSELGVYY